MQAGRFPGSFLFIVNSAYLPPEKWHNCACSLSQRWVRFTVIVNFVRFESNITIRARGVSSMILWYNDRKTYTNSNNIWFWCAQTTYHVFLSLRTIQVKKYSEGNFLFGRRMLPALTLTSSKSVRENLKLIARLLR